MKKPRFYLNFPDLNSNDIFELATSIAGIMVVLIMPIYWLLTYESVILSPSEIWTNVQVGYFISCVFIMPFIVFIGVWAIAWLGWSIQHLWNEWVLDRIIFLIMESLRKKKSNEIS